MERVVITKASSAHPPYRMTQTEAAARIGAVTGEPRRAVAIARGTRIDERAFCIPPADVARLGSISERNAIYREKAPRLAMEAAVLAASGDEASIACLVTSSCTGYMVPGWDASLVSELPLGCYTVRLPITQAGCAGGVVALARSADFLRSRPGTSALAVSAELCSLAFQASADEGSITSNLIFGDGAGAALLDSSPSATGLEIVDSLSLLAPAPERVLGFALTDRGFASLLSRDLVEVLPPATGEAVIRLLGRTGLREADIGFWLLHPGGARILSQLEKALRLPDCADRWSWASMAAHGNTSSAAIFDVIRRYLEDEAAPRGWGVVAAFGPGISIELLLVRSC
ncbi:MAG TPA: 3-oxoacyl-[acyl-carrier-protein] synthase III C-terminal domain-containing protein [Dehalococcoidia bacterium]